MVQAIGKGEFMKQLLFTLILFFSSAYSFASVCIESPAYCEATLDALARFEVTSNKTYEYGSRVTNSCQYEAFISLLSAEQFSVKKYKMASLISNSIQLQAFNCLANAELNSDSLYQIALEVRSQCGANAVW